MWKSGQATRYEIVAVHGDGRRYLICYAANKSIRAMVRLINNFGEDIVAVLGLSDTVRMWRSAEPFPHFALGNTKDDKNGWRIYASGRTQRDVQAEGGELSFIGALAKQMKDSAVKSA
jgi:hypothetical protein